MTAGTAIHVHPGSRGDWCVRHEDETAPASRHTTVTEAEKAARSHALASGASFVLVHDLYQRVRRTPVPRRPQR